MKTFAKNLWVGLRKMLTIVLCIAPSGAQAYDIEQIQKEFIGKSQLAMIRVVPQDRKAEVYLTGIKAAELSPKLVAVTLFDGINSKPLRFRMTENRYQLDLPKKRSQSYDLEFETETQGQKEKIKVSIP